MCWTCGYGLPLNWPARPVQLSVTVAMFPWSAMVAIPEPVAWFNGLSVAWYDVPEAAMAGPAANARGTAATANGARTRSAFCMDFPFNRRSPRRKGGGAVGVALLFTGD